MGTVLSERRLGTVDAVKSAAICGTLLIHASAAGGFQWETGSFPWLSALFWNSLLRCAVPLFFLCSGALLLRPEKEITVSMVWRKYLLRIAIALFFWAAAYSAVSLLNAWRQTGVLEAAALRQAAADLIFFRHKDHLYYLHIILLVYAVLPLTRLLAARADRQLQNYALALWFVLGCLLPTARDFFPVSRLAGIPVQTFLNLTWGSVGYTLLGFVMSRREPKRGAGFYLLLYLLGFGATFLGTWGMSIHRGQGLYTGFLQGFSPSVCLQAVGLFGFFGALFRDREAPRAAVVLSKASFCIYLSHMFLLDFLTNHGLSPAVRQPLWDVPLLAVLLLAGCLALWWVLKRIPWVNRYLI